MCVAIEGTTPNVILSKFSSLVVEGILIVGMLIDHAIDTRNKNALDRTTNNVQVKWVGATNRKL